MSGATVLLPADLLGVAVFAASGASAAVAKRLDRTVLVLDAAGLGPFTVAGTVKALDAGVRAVGSCVTGMVTGIGGGVLRDLRIGEIAAGLQRDIYAVAALGGAVLVAALVRLESAGPLPLAAAAPLIIGVRLPALRRRWSVPVAGVSPGPGAEA